MRHTADDTLRILNNKPSLLPGDQNTTNKLLCNIEGGPSISNKLASIPTSEGVVTDDYVERSITRFVPSNIPTHPGLYKQRKTNNLPPPPNNKQDSMVKIITTSSVPLSKQDF